MNLTVQVYQALFPGTSLLVLDPGELSINGEVNNAIPHTELTVEVDNGCPAEILVSHAGFKSYSMTVDNVYSTDTTISVVLVQDIPDINDPNYLRPHPALFTFTDPCTFCVDTYSATSYGGEISWYVNNELYKEGDTKVVSCFCNTGNYQIKMRSETSQSVVESPGCPPTVVKLWDLQYATIETGNTVVSEIEPLDTYLVQDTSTNITIEEYRVGIDLVVTSEVSPLVNNDCCLYSRDEEVTVTPIITLNRAGADPALHTITWKVVDPEGVTLPLLQDTFPIDIDPSLYSITFLLNKLGIYTVTATVDDLECDTTFVQETSVETCNFIYSKYLECGTFEIQNRSSATPFDYSIADIATLSTVVAEGTLEPGMAIQVSFPDVSMYIMTAKYLRNDVEITEEYVMNNYCQIERCLSNYIEELLCAPTERCADPCPPESDLKQMFLFYNTYFMKIHKMFNVNSYFSALDEEGLNEITTLKQLMDKMLSFCGRMNCTDSTTSAFQGEYITEGPYDYTGQGTTLDSGCKTCGS